MLESAWEKYLEVSAWECLREVLKSIIHDLLIITI